MVGEAASIPWMRVNDHASRRVSMVMRRQLLAAFVWLLACSPSLDDGEVPSAPEIAASTGAVPDTWELPAQCEGWTHLEAEERPENYLYIEFDREIVDLKSSNAGDCMPAVMRQLADDPPSQPLTLRIGGALSQPSSRQSTIVAAIRALKGPAESCANERSLMRLDLAVEPQRGSIVDATVHDPEGTEAEACLVDAARNLQLGPIEGIDQTTYFSLLLGVGPSASGGSDI
jgi:hypothetical protein